MPWAKRATRPIPSTSVRTTGLELNDYSLGMNSFVSNDKFPVKDGGSNLWRLAQNGRIPTLGEYETRKDFDFHSDSAGETIDASETATTGAADQAFTEITRLAQQVSAVTSGRLTRIDVRLKNSATATGTVIVELWSSTAGVPGTRLARSSVASSTLTSSYAYVTARFAAAPTVTALTTYWLVVYVQSNGSGSYYWSSTTATTNALTSSNSGGSWTSAAFSLNYKFYYATSNGSKGLYRAYKSDGTAVTLIAHNTTLYKVDDVTGALTAVKTGLSASATHYRFETVNDIVYYVNGFDGYRKWDFTTESQVNSTNYSHIRQHKGLMFLVDKNDPNKVVYSNFADYETFTSTDFIYVPSPKTGDPVTALNSLNGYLDLHTLNNNFILSGDDNATFSLDEAPDQNGTYSQETITQDDNFMYYLTNTGIYRSNGSEAQLLSENAYEAIRTMENKDDCCLVVNRGRLYLWYRSDGTAYNDACYVWNLNYGSSAETIESLDTGAYVTRAVSCFKDDDKLLVASSLIGQAYWQENDSNDYTNLGGDIDFCLQTHYFTFGSPAVQKQIRRWIARFGAQSDDYSIDCDYAYDQRDNWTTHATPNIQGSGAVWGSATWGSFTWGTTAEVEQSMYVPGDRKRIAVRYKHYAARQPVKFLGHTLEAQLRRLR